LDNDGRRKLFNLHGEKIITGSYKYKYSFGVALDFRNKILSGDTNA
jgi:hypothetical protein